MNLPENGKIVIIEDEINAALSLIKALSKKGISTVYFDGVEIDNLPQKPIENVRMVFLDIELGTEGQSDKNKVSKVITILKRILGEPNHPYIILAWTRFIVLKEQIEKGLQDYPPLFFLNMEKDECKDNNGEFDINKIENRLRTEFAKAGIFQLFILWENIVHKASGNVVNEISYIQTYDEKWNENMQNVFYEMAKAYSGKQLDKSNAVKPSLMTFNEVFIDTLESLIIKNSELNLKVFDNNTFAGLDNKIRAKINSKLLLIFEGNQKIIPGNVYRLEKNLSKMKPMVNDALNRDYMHEIYCKNKKIKLDELVDEMRRIKKEYKKSIDEFSKSLRSTIAKKSISIELEVSPACDYYQDKWIYSRLVKGILWHEDYNKFLNRADYLYISPLLRIKNENYKLVFDYRYLRGVTVKEHDFKSTQPFFRIRHELLVDIQSHLARHINRPGVIFLA